MRNTIHLLTLILIVLTLGGGLAHVYAFPNKIDLPMDDYFVVQQIYSGWNLLGIPMIGGLLSAVAFTAIAWRDSAARWFGVVGCICLLASLGVFFALTFPANQQTVNWTTLPENWQTLRRQWEYGHLASAAF